MSPMFDEPAEEVRKPRIAILGYGAQAKSAYNYWINVTDDVTICDANPNLELPSADVQTRLGSDYLRGLDQFDILVRSPGLHPRDIVAANMQDPSVLASVTSNTNEFLRICPTRNIIGVTGTKGKGTTSTLIAKMLEAVLGADPGTAGNRVHLGGNIGIPPLELLRNDIKPDDWVVLELANFQLIDLKFSPPLAVCLMVAPEHMDWHSDMAEYIEAKQQLFRWQGPEDVAVYYADNEHSREVVEISTAGQKVPYFRAPGAYVENGNIVIEGKIICATSELKLLGKHNWQNACAAATVVWQLTNNLDALNSVLTTFTGLEHRLELVREVGGVKYYDDSFGTTPETAMVAIEAFTEPKIVILGGSDKGASYDKLAETVIKNNVKRVITIGAQAAKITEALGLAGYHGITEGRNTMPEIVQQAQKLAAPGDVVLLSTGCASFDMFKNYKDRAEQFQKAVKNLPEPAPAPAAPAPSAQ